MKHTISIFLGICWLSCHQIGNQPDSASSLIVENDISKMTDSLEKDLFRSGPLAWVSYFENKPGFFMISDGELAFKDYSTGKEFIEKTLVTKIVKVNLTLDHLEIHALMTQLASLAAHFHEDLTDPAGNSKSISGYLTSVLEKTDQGWKFLNLHWSSQR
jgi:hypothetical protein